MQDRTDSRPVEGDLVVDTRRGVLARVMAIAPEWCSLRPADGGVEWDAAHDEVRPATASDRLADRMRAAGLLTSPGTR